MREPVLTLTTVWGTKPSVNGLVRVSEAGDDGACFRLHRELHELPVVARFTIDGEPVSKARARFTKQASKVQAFTPEKTLQAEQIVGWKFRAAARGHSLDAEAAYGVMALFFCGTRQRRDVDNMLKLILDGLNKVAWPDDAQVAEVSARKMLTLPGSARTEVLIYQAGRIQHFTSACKQCGREFPISPSTADKKFCSQGCAAAGKRRVPEDRICKGCGNTFTVDRAHARQVYCSAECSVGRATVACTGCGTEFTKQRCHVRVKNYCSAKCRDEDARDRRTAAARGTCETCGGPTSKKTYRQCQACRVLALGISGEPRTVA
jgi:Holliday junction resolvase RusA-like endonuclease